MPSVEERLRYWRDRALTAEARAEKAEAVADQFADLIKGDSTGAEWKHGCKEALASHAKLKRDRHDT